MSGFYYKDWREVFKWPKIGDRGTGEAGNPQGSFGRAGGRRAPSQAQEEEVRATQADDEVWFVGTRPKDQNKSVWQVHDVFLREDRVDRERLQSEHATENEARLAGSRRAIKHGVAHVRQQEPGPYFADTSHGYSAQYKKPQGGMEEGLN